MKTLKQFTEGTGYLKVKSPDEQKFVDKHKTETIPDANGNGDEVFKASNVKKVPRKAERKGYEPGEDEAVYEAMDAAARFDHHHQHAKALMKSISQHLKTHAAEAASYKDHRGRKGPSWGHTGSMEHIANQLSNIHDQLARQGEYSMHEEVDLDEKKLTPAEMKKREEVAKAIERENPKMPMAKKMAIATATAKKVAEQANQIDELSQDKLMAYRSAAKKQGSGIQDKMKVGGGDWSKDGKDTGTLKKRMAGYKMAGRKVNPGLAATAGKAPRVAATEDFEQAIESLSPRLQEAMLHVHDRLSEENRDKFVTACQTEEGLEKMVAFALENRGE